MCQEVAAPGERSDGPAGRCHKRKGSLEMERKDFPSRFPRLPLPEMAGSDRDEPHCLPGFVDRAYLVFLSNYGPQLLAASSDCSKTDPSSSHPLRVFAADSFGVRGGVRAPDDPSPTRASSIRMAAGRLKRPMSADGGAGSRSGLPSSFAPFPLGGADPAALQPDWPASPYPTRAFRMARANSPSPRARRGAKSATACMSIE